MARIVRGPRRLAGRSRRPLGNRIDQRLSGSTKRLAPRGDGWRDWNAISAVHAETLPACSGAALRERARVRHLPPGWIGCGCGMPSLGPRWRDGHRRHGGRQERASQALEIARTVADIAVETRSARMRRELVTLQRAMRPWQDAPVGRDLAEIQATALPLKRRSYAVSVAALSPSTIRTDPLTHLGSGFCRSLAAQVEAAVVRKRCLQSTGATTADEYTAVTSGQNPVSGQPATVIRGNEPCE
ncbi:hypothetical protein SAMN05442782_1426 [Streptomyces sp. OK228]|nr:hypothetical protein SAMN05442782_1426 [Streptomyces sp. OK228]